MSYFEIERRAHKDDHDRLLRRHGSIRNLYVHDTRRPTRASMLAMLTWNVRREVQAYWAMLDASRRPRLRQRRRES